MSEPIKLVHPDLPGQPIHVTSVSHEYARAGWVRADELLDLDKHAGEVPDTTGESSPSSKEKKS